MNRLYGFIWILLAGILACTPTQKKNDNTNSADSLSGDLIVFHAGSLSVPLKEIAASFKQEHPKVNILMEAAGSVECARKITELKKECDVLATSDYKVIDKMVIPEYADWNIKFASNEMAIVYTQKSKRCREINKDNWYTIMLDKNIQIGRADPNQDPCGYRTVLVSKLAEKYYQQKGLAAQLLTKDKNNIRPKEVDLLALLETGNVDYIFLYRSVAIQHKLEFIVLPDEINLKNVEFSELYSTVSVETAGKKPNETLTQTGEPMVYGITIPKAAPHTKLAKAFVKFLLTKEKGMAIMEKQGQPSVIPSPTQTYSLLPDDLKPYAQAVKK